MAATVEVDFLEALTSYDRLTNEKHYSPQSKFEVSPEEVLGYHRQVSIFSAKGVAVSNHLVNLSIPLQIYLNISQQLDQLLEIDPTNIHIQEAARSRDKTNNLLTSVCNYDGRIEKRFILATLIVSFLTTLATSSITTVGVYAALGKFDSQNLVEEEIGLADKKNDKQKNLDQFFFRRIKEIRKQSNSLAHRMEVNDAAAIINMDFEHLMVYLESIIEVQSYDFTPSKFLDNIEKTLVNNTKFTKLMSGGQFGLRGTTTLLSLSETESLLMSEDDSHVCERSSIITKFKTIIPDERYQAKGTEDKFRYKIDEARSLYINPKMILEKSKFRPIATFSKQRSIVGHDSKIQSIMPYNNTFIHVKTSGGFNVVKKCKNETQEIRIFKNPWMKIPIHCTIESAFLNVSEFHIIYTLNEVDARDEIHEIQHVDFSPLYDHNEEEDIQDYEMEQKIEEIYQIGKHITTIDKQILADRSDRERIVEGFNNAASGIKNFFVGLIQSCILDPFYQVVSSLGLILLLICLALWIRRRRNKRQRKKVVDSDK